MKKIVKTYEIMQQTEGYKSEHNQSVS